MRSDEADADVVIVGGGFSGTMLAAQLARQGLSSIIVEGGNRAGRGTAFSTPDPAHLLNVPAARMSAWPDRPDDFANHVAGHGYAPGDFVPRREFGAYLRGILDEAVSGGRVQLLEAEAMDAVQAADGWTIRAGSHLIKGRALALAQGNQAPCRPPSAKTLPPAQFVNDPWSDEGRTAIGRAAAGGEDVLAIGTGLTMVDVALSLAQAGHSGGLLAVSRRGLTPRAHAAHQAAPVSLDEIPNGSLTTLCRWLRHYSSAVGWRAAVDSLRPHSQALWHSLDVEDHKRFLRHARPWWDVHRHRVAPQVAEALARMMRDGRLEVMAGRIESLSNEAGGAIHAEIVPRGASANVRRRFGLVVNCTGPLGDIQSSEDPLLRHLLAAGKIQPDDLRLGLAVDGTGKVNSSDRMWALGPLTKGVWWEIVAVPDIRQQVTVVADDIAEELE